VLFLTLLVSKAQLSALKLSDRNFVRLFQPAAHLHCSEKLCASTTDSEYSLVSPPEFINLHRVPSLQLTHHPSKDNPAFKKNGYKRKKDRPSEQNILCLVKYFPHSISQLFIDS